MATILNLVTNVLLLGALYSLIAIGFTLIFGVGGVLNLAHGALITVGAYTAYYLTNAGLSIWLGAVGAIVVSALIAAAMYKGMIRYVQESPVTVLILTLVISIIVEQFLLAVAGSTTIVLADFVSGNIAVAGSSVQVNRVFAFFLSVVLLGALFLFVNRTKRGKAILATSMSHKGASLVGIKSERIYTYTWLIGGALAGIAGVFIASFRGGHPLMGRAPLLLAFSIVVLGGLGSIKGSIVGAYLVSFLDQVTVTFISTRLSGVAGLIVLVLVLLIKPEGLYGREFTE
ncbi:MAG: branched-chain amino acid ABC transporter permease [Halorientalis sp.]